MNDIWTVLFNAAMALAMLGSTGNPTFAVLTFVVLNKLCEIQSRLEGLK